MGSGPSKENTEKQLQDLQTEAGKLLKDLVDSKIVESLVNMHKEQKQYYLYDILKRVTNMKPSEISYCIEVVLPIFAGYNEPSRNNAGIATNVVDAGGHVVQHMIVKYTVFIDIYKGLLERKEDLIIEIEKIMCNCISVGNRV